MLQNCACHTTPPPLQPRHAACARRSPRARPRRRRAAPGGSRRGSSTGRSASRPTAPAARRRSCLRATPARQGARRRDGTPGLVISGLYTILKLPARHHCQGDGARLGPAHESGSRATARSAAGTLTATLGLRISSSSTSSRPLREPTGGARWILLSEWNATPPLATAPPMPPSSVPCEPEAPVMDALDPVRLYEVMRAAAARASASSTSLSVRPRLNCQRRSRSQ